jgi:PIN domain nuclease of toxin-antitoxin system
MNFLVDTNGWLAFLQNAPELSSHAADLMEREGSNCFVSIASLWEAAIKVGKGKLILPYDLRLDLPRIFAQNGFEILPLSPVCVLAVRDLLPLHGDPFDRIQVCQAQESNLIMISRDPIFEKYGLKRIW